MLLFVGVFVIFFVGIVVFVELVVFVEFWVFVFVLFAVLVVFVGDVVFVIFKIGKIAICLKLTENKIAPISAVGSL